MSIADKLEKLTTDITSAYDAIDEKGGTIPEHKNTENLSDAILSIEGGGTFSCKTDYGRFWYIPWETVVAVGYSDGCSVVVDNDKFTAYLENNPIRSFGEDERANFDYDTGSETWSSWSFENPVSGLTSAQMAEQLGLSVTINAGAEFAAFEVSVSTAPVSGADWTHIDLTSDGWTALTNTQQYDSGYNVGSIVIPAMSARRFEFGTVPTTIPNSFLALQGSELVEIGEIPSNFTGSLIDAFTNTKLNSPLIISPSIKWVSLDSMSHFNSPIIYNPSARGSSSETISFTLLRLESFNSPIYIGQNANILSIKNLAVFNQKIYFPDSVQSLGMNHLPAYNQDIILPSSLTRLEYESFYGCNNFTGVVNVGNLSPSVVRNTNKTYLFAASSSTAPSYTTGIKIAGQNRAAWLSDFPNEAITTGNPRFRKLLDAGY